MSFSSTAREEPGFGVKGCGLRQKLGGLRVRQAVLQCGIPQRTLRFSRLGLPTATTKTLVFAGFHLHLSLLFSCFSVTSKHISDFFLIQKSIDLCVDLILDLSRGFSTLWLLQYMACLKL